MTTWAPERTEACITLWAAGKSASEIAQILGGITRNSVISKIHRMGVSKREKPSPANVVKAVKARRTAVKTVKAIIIPPPPPPPPVIERKPENGVSLMDLERNMCRNSIYEENGEHMFCGNLVYARGKPYCYSCNDKLTRKEEPRKKKKPAVDVWAKRINEL